MFESKQSIKEPGFFQQPVKLDGANLGAEDTTSPYSIFFNSTTLSEGGHVLTAVARDAVPLTTTSDPVNVTVNNLPAGDPVSFWKFDEAPGSVVAVDSSANLNHLTLTSGATFAPGNINNALVLKGTSGEATDTATSGLNIFGAITIAAFLRPNSLPAGFSTVVTKGDISANRGYGLNIDGGFLNFVKLNNINVKSNVSLPTGA